MIVYHCKYCRVLYTVPLYTRTNTIYIYCMKLQSHYLFQLKPTSKSYIKLIVATISDYK